MNPFDHVAEKFNATKGLVTTTEENAIAIKYKDNDGCDVTIFIAPNPRSVEHEFARARDGRTLPNSRYASIPVKNFEQALFITSIQATCIMSSIMDEGAVS